MKDLNMAYYFSIFIHFSGEEPTFIENAIKQIEKLSDDSESQKQLETVLDIIGNICQNSQKNHDELLSKLENLKTIRK